MSSCCRAARLRLFMSSAETTVNLQSRQWANRSRHHWTHMGNLHSVTMTRLTQFPGCLLCHEPGCGTTPSAPVRNPRQMHSDSAAQPQFALSTFEIQCTCSGHLLRGFNFIIHLPLTYVLSMSSGLWKQHVLHQQPWMKLD